MAAFLNHDVVPFLTYIFTFTFIFMTIHPSMTPTKFLVQADEQLIQTFCDKTPQPIRCRGCLHEDPKTPTADTKGLTLSMMDCASTDTQDVIAKVQSLETVTPQGPLHEALIACEKYESTGLGAIPQAQSQVSAGKKDEATALINTAKDNHKKCYGQYKQLPQLLVGPVDFLSKDLDIILSMIQNI